MFIGISVEGKVCDNENAQKQMAKWNGRRRKSNSSVSNTEVTAAQLHHQIDQRTELEYSAGPLILHDKDTKVLPHLNETVFLPQELCCGRRCLCKTNSEVDSVSKHKGTKKKYIL